MVDRRTRDLERRWQESGDESVLEQLVRQRARTGQAVQDEPEALMALELVHWTRQQKRSLLPYDMVLFRGGFLPLVITRKRLEAVAAEAFGSKKAAKAWWRKEHKSEDSHRAHFYNDKFSWQELIALAQLGNIDLLAATVRAVAERNEMDNKFAALWTHDYPARSLDTSRIGTPFYGGIAYFWSYEYRHTLRLATSPRRIRVHDAWLAAGLPLDGESDLHQEIMEKVW